MSFLPHAGAAFYYYTNVVTKPGVFTINNYSDGKAFSKLFRFRTKADLLTFFHLLGMPDEVLVEKAARFSGIEILCITLRRLASKASLRDLQYEFNRSEPDLCRAFRYGVSYICEKFGHLLNETQLFWFDVPYFDQFASAARHNFLTPSPCRYIAAVDGTFRRVCRPKKLNQVWFYSGYKKAHGIKFQGVMAFNGLFVKMTGPYHGRVHDATMYSHSKLLEHIRSLLENADNAEQYIIIGDTAYPTDINSQALLKRKAMNNEKLRKWNSLVGNARRCVEHGFGQISNNWRYVDDVHAQRTGITDPGPADCYRAAALLTNCLTCLYGNVVNRNFYYFVDDDGTEKRTFLPTMQQYLRNSEAA